MRSQTTRRTGNPAEKELAIKKKIHEVFLERQLKERNALEGAIFDNMKKYQEFRTEREKTLFDIEKDRIKIQRRKKSQKIILRQLKANTRKKLLILCQVLGKTALFFKKMYVESDHYRRIKLQDIQNGIMVSKFELDIIKERDEKFRQNRLATLI